MLASLNHPNIASIYDPEEPAGRNLLVIFSETSEICQQRTIVCGVRVEEVEDETMRKIRYLDKLVDELAKGKAMEKILRK